MPPKTTSSVSVSGIAIMVAAVAMVSWDNNVWSEEDRDCVPPQPSWATREVMNHQALSIPAGIAGAGNVGQTGQRNPENSPDTRPSARGGAQIEHDFGCRRSPWRTGR